MAICSSCGSEVSGQSKFCTACGKPIAAAVAAPAPVTPACTSCGSPLQPNSRFCTACGALVATATTTVAESPLKQQPADPVPAEPIPGETSQPVALAQATAPSVSQMDI